MPPETNENTENTEIQTSQAAPDAPASEPSAVPTTETAKTEEPAAGPLEPTKPAAEPSGNENGLTMGIDAGVDTAKVPDAPASEPSEAPATETPQSEESNPIATAYRGMLFPASKEAYEIRSKEERVIPAEAWKWLRKEASKMLGDSTIKSRPLRAHLYDIICEKPPFGYTVEGKVND